MATWFKCPDSSYVNVNTLGQVFVAPDPNSVGTFTIYGISVAGQVLPQPLGGVNNGSIITLKTGFATAAAAQTALDNNMTLNLGGIV